MSRLHRAPETEALAALVPLARLSDAERAPVGERSQAFVVNLRAQRRQPWMERFLQEYDLGAEEGLVLMTMAESLLRVPDARTANLLLQDKIGRGDWMGRVGRSGSLMVDGASLGLAAAGGVLADDAGVLRGLVRRVGAPVVRSAVETSVRMMGAQFIHGRTIEESLAAAHRQGQVCSFDMLGEAARTAADAERYFESYLSAIRAAGAAAPADAPPLGRHSVSVKLSALHPRYEVSQWVRCVPELAERLIALASEAAKGGVSLTVDAEESERLEMSLDIISLAAASPALEGWNGLGMAIQAYQKRALAVIDWAEATAVATGRTLQVRLVKGAYWDTEIKRAQERGLSDYPVFTTKPATDVSYLACARRLLGSKHLQPAFATHNAQTVSTLLEWIGPRRDVEFQRLHGMGEALYRQVAEAQGPQCRVYAPVGGERDLLAYLVRRLLENGANSSFVNRLADPEVLGDALLTDPVDQVVASGCAANPRIPKPADIYGAERRNSQGVDLWDSDALLGLEAELQVFWAETASAGPIVGGRRLDGPAAPVVDPADAERVVGLAKSATPDVARRAIELAYAAFPAWSSRPASTRAGILRRTADLLERDCVRLIALLTREAGKTRADAVAEVREAVDFCRYYAREAEALDWRQSLPGPTGERNELVLGGRGVFVCISPWNFPLAIFLGQVVAALVTGNTVAAKPAPQTPLVAAAAIELLHEAGVPPDVVHLLPGGGDVGEALCADPRVAGVCFTGSTATAKRIARTLLVDDARPLIPLIAETGGVNAMIVDSTALTEQVVADVVASAFQSAGQRCSALRLLCLQEDIAAQTLEMLEGAMAQLEIGDPSRLSTDVGPVIDAQARARIDAYLGANTDKILYRTPDPGGASGHFVRPTLMRVQRVQDLKEEVFGPVLHVVTWKAGDLDGLIDQINASGYGLTLGVHSRIASVADRVRARARVGNVYVNRTIIGAVVGSQPFGGEGLSGTGPKAGGPHYLLRFCTERASSEDTTAAGGNASLMTLES